MANAKSKAATAANGAAATATAKTGQAAKAASPAPVAPVKPVAPKGFVVHAAYGTAPVQLGLKPSQGYPQGAQPVVLLPQPAGLSAQQQGYYKALAAAGAGATPVACNVLVAGLQANGATGSTARRVLRRAVRAWCVAWQPANA